QSPASHPPVDVRLDLRPLSSTGIPRLRRYYGPVRHPWRPGLSLTGVRLEVTRLHRLGLHVLCWVSVCRHAVATTPVGPLAHVASRGVTPISPETAAFPVMLAGRLPRHFFRGLLSVHSRYGLPARRTPAAARCLGGFGGFVTSAAAPIASGWSD